VGEDGESFVHGCRYPTFPGANRLACYSE
jgi:hypothetical protein